MVVIPVKKAVIDYDYSEIDGFKITVEVASGYTHSANTIKKLIESGASLEFTLKKATEDKTRKQLGLAWSAMDEIAKALELPVNDVYRHIIREYGKCEHIMIPTPEAERIIELHDESRNGNFGEIVGVSKQNPDCTVIRLYYGISSYNKEEMSRFLDGVDAYHTEVIC